jgi:hypothetical protein
MAINIDSLSFLIQNFTTQKQIDDYIFILKRMHLLRTNKCIYKTNGLSRLCWRGWIWVQAQ